MQEGFVANEVVVASVDACASVLAIVSVYMVCIYIPAAVLVQS